MITKPSLLGISRLRNWRRRKQKCRISKRNICKSVRRN